MKELLLLFAATDSPDLRTGIIEGLGSLVSREQEDLLCREVLENGVPEMVNLVTVRGYTPGDPADQVLFFFITGQREHLSGMDTAAGCRLLAEGYEQAGPAARRNALRRACDSRTCNLLAAALAGDPVTRSAGGWSPAEWEVVMSGLIQDRRWADLWQLAPYAPPQLAVAALSAIRSSGWMPPGESAKVFSEIVADLPREWSYPVPAGPLTRSIGRPASRVVRLAFSPDSSLIATCSCDGIISVWDIRSVQNRVTVRTGTGSARFLAITPDNTRIIFGSDDGALHCHELQEGRRTWSWPGNGGDEAGAAVLSGDGLTVITGDTGGIIHVLFVDGGKTGGVIPAHPSPVTCFAISRDGIGLAAGHTDGTVSLLDFPARTCLSVLNGAGDAVRSITFSDDRSQVLVLYDRAPPSLWETATGVKVRVFSGQCGTVVCSAVSPAGSWWWAAGSSDHTLRCWDWSGKVPVATVPFYSRHITCCAPAPDGSLLATGYSDGTIRLYTMPASTLIREFKGHKKAVTCCTISPDGTGFATASWDGTVKVWHLPSGEIRRTLEHHAGDVVSLATSPDHPAVIAAMSDGFIRVYPDGDLNPARVVDMYTPGIRAVAASPGGTSLACAGTDATLRIWNLDDGTLVAGADRLSTTLRCLAWMPDGSALLSGGWDGKVRKWSVTDCLLVSTCRGHASIVTCMALSRDGRLLATGSNDTTVGLWRTGEQVPYAFIRDSRSEVSALALSHDGSLLAAGGADTVIRLYRLPEGAPDGTLAGLPGKVTALSITPDGLMLAAGYESGTLAFFSLQENKLIRTVPAHSAAVSGIVLTGGGTELTTGGRDGMVRSWVLPWTRLLSDTTLADIPAVREQAAAAGRKNDADSWTFLDRMLSYRFRSEIELCDCRQVPGVYDIQICG